MAFAWWPCLILALLSSLAASGFPRSPFRLLGKRSLPEGVANGIEVYSTKINSKVTSRFAHNVVTMRAVNRADTAKEVSFDVELPKTAFITNFTLTIDGVTYPGNVKEKEVAKKQYEKAVSQGKTAGLVKASGRKLEKFTVSVNVAAGSKVTFELTYEELLKRHKGKYEMYLKVQPKQLVKHFEIEVDIFEPQGISMLDAEASFITNDLLGSALTKSFSGKKGHVSFKPSLDQQRSCPTCTDSLLNGDFTITYDVNRESPGNVQIVNGYFVHFFAPQGLPVVPKNVAFVIDISGSMAGRKLEQTKEALLRILEDMQEEDYLNFILFSGDVSTWKEHLVQATPENLQEARTFVKSMEDKGMTNINDGLLRGISMLNKAREEHRIPERSTSIVIMLTDGDANVGESRPEKIQENVRNAIGGKFPLYNLGFGNNLNYNFLENMALENHGFARRIYEDSDADLQLQGFYEEVANPLLTGVEMEYPENAILDLTQNTYQHFYDGSEIVVAGRLVDEDMNSFKADVKGHGATNDLTFTEEVTTEKITLWNRAVPSTFSWLDTVTVTQDGLSMMINRKNMVVSFGDGVTFVVVLHQVWKKHPVHRDFLGFYVVDSHRMSAQTHGLLGQFFQPFDFKVSDIRPGSDPTKPDATLVVKNHQLIVTRGSQKDYRKDASIGTKVVCWFVHNNGEGLIDGVHTDYIVPNLF
ncbi:inter-alpha-trypsin inhibitor heavy chain 3 [Homo sapiens]|uniref:Inter-alpha-trypsin inhibitor heavy chain H3 n=1 Tax=Homo sapiens TaxID=9606 RepID=E7ET33_HUMAN|nr:inter-alpha-trypsin inhibitor heavy chain H3 isoform 10 precursor [Homo sapiens]KAI4030101.1 inter-alpha-trypsin inhibitor heavy chain 3 [Homo sapiens]